MLSVVEIGDRAFRNTSNLKTVIMDKVLKIGTSAFENALLLETVEMSNIKTIKAGAFVGDEKLTLDLNVNVFIDSEQPVFSDNTVVRINRCKDSTGLDKNSEIWNGTIEYLDDIFLFNIATGAILGIKDGKTAPQDLIIPEVINGVNVVKIADGTFENSILLETVEAPKVQTIKTGAFVGDTALLNLSLNGDVRIDSTEEVFSYNTTVTIQITKDTTGLDQNYDLWGSTIVYIENIFEFNAEIRAIIGVKRGHKVPENLIIPSEMV